MAGRFSRSWQIFKSSAAVLRENKKLLVFPLLSSITALLVMASFGSAYLFLDIGNQQTSGSESSTVEMVILFGIYVILYAVTFFFNTALVAAAAKFMDGGEPTVRHGLGVAFSKIGSILGYATIAATVGLLLRALEQRLGFIGQIVVSIIGVAWTAATFLVVPLLVHRDIGPMDAVKESATLLKETWGENIIANSGMAIVFTLFYVPLVGVIVATGFTLLFGTGSAGNSNDQLITWSVLVAAVMLLVILVLVHSALQGIYGAALYRYATDSSDESDTGDFGPNLLADAFAPK